MILRSPSPSPCSPLDKVPFYCAQDEKTTALDACKVAPDLINVTTLVDITHTVATDGLIDDPQNMADDKVYLFSGTLDTVVVPGMFP